jgi:hypothetical protein
MIRIGVLLAALLLIPTSLAQKGETPPYDPAPPADKMTLYVNSDLAFTLSYPKEFVARTPEDLQTVMERGHRAVYGTDPKSDPEHLEAVRCMHTLFYATFGPTLLDSKVSAATATDVSSPDTILVEDFDRTCVPKKEKGDKVLSDIAASVLSSPDETQVVHQMWFVAGGDRRIHSGMAATMVSVKQDAVGASSSGSSHDVPLFIIASTFEQKAHLILIVYFSGTDGARHETVPHMSVAFEDGRPVLLFPFMLENANLIK